MAFVGSKGRERDEIQMLIKAVEVNFKQIEILFSLGKIQVMYLSLMIL